MTDPYWKLRSPPPTPDEELCPCVGAPPFVLNASCAANPVCCIACNLEVPPERIGCSEALAEKLAFWRTFHDSFHVLWLDSREYESWARAQLEDPRSPVNQRGLALTSELNALHRTYYWWFQDTGTEDFEPASRCPVCRGDLLEQHRRLLCERCSILIAN